ncbi:MAG TPA: hypothetical protein VFQ41_17010 [Candidatus Angelobacter sp.]|nr:hypothetical protein [Candidatus Angelobacter sp.]
MTKRKQLTSRKDSLGHGAGGERYSLDWPEYRIGQFNIIPCLDAVRQQFVVQLGITEVQWNQRLPVPSSHF